jgi:hypothetical protein
MLTTCGKSEKIINPTGNQTGAALFKMTAAPKSIFMLLADSAVLTISAGDMLPMRKVLQVTDSTVEGIVERIPAGKNRSFSINVYDSMKTLQYTGSTLSDVIADSTVTVLVPITRVSGGATVRVIIDSLDTMPIPIPTLNLIAYYPFSGTFNDLSGNNNHGTATGGISFTNDRSGKTNNACTFDGVDDRIDVPHCVSLNALPLSVSFWCRTTQQFTDYVDVMMINKYISSSNNGYGVFFEHTGKIGAFYFKGTNNDHVYMTFTDSAYNNGKWHHVAFLIDSTGGYLSVNGNQKFNAWTGTWGSTTTTESFHIGYYPPGSIPRYTGDIDDVRIYNRKLSSLELFSLLNEGSL